MTLPRPARVVMRRAVRVGAYGAIGAVGLLGRLGRKPAPSHAVRRILVCRLDLLGDLLFTRPLLLAMRTTYPDAHITLLTLPYTEPLGRLFCEVDEVVTVDTNRIRTVRGLTSKSTWVEYIKVARILRRSHFDLGISVCGRMASLCVYLSGALRTVGYSAEGYPFLLDLEVDGGRYRQRKHEVEYVRALADSAGARGAPHRLGPAVPESVRAVMRARLVSMGIGINDRLVVIHAGAVNGSAKRWPTAYWAEFADCMTLELNARVVLTGAPSDEPLAQEVRARATTTVFSLVGETTVPELLALIERADLVASGDSGPLHLAVALERPLVAAYGPTDPRIHGPYHALAETRVHRADLPCSPCYSMAATAECPLGDPICMRLVSVEQMVGSARDLLTT